MPWNEHPYPILVTHDIYPGWLRRDKTISTSIHYTLEAEALAFIPTFLPFCRHQGRGADCCVTALSTAAASALHWLDIKSLCSAPWRNQMQPYPPP